MGGCHEKQTIHKITQDEKVVIDEKATAQCLVSQHSDPLPRDVFQNSALG